jgi:hypothetical protein
MAKDEDLSIFVATFSTFITTATMAYPMTMHMRGTEERAITIV